MSREIMQQALDALKHHRQQTTYQFQQTSDAIKALEQELAKPEQDFYPDWDMLKPFHDRIAELETQLAQPEQEPCKPWVGLTDDEIKHIMGCWRNGYIDIKKVEQLLKDKNT